MNVGGSMGEIALIYALDYFPARDEIPGSARSAPDFGNARFQRDGGRFSPTLGSGVALKLESQP